MSVQTQLPGDRPASRRRQLAALVLIPFGIMFMGADKGCVTSPAPDSIVVSNPKVQGNISEFDASDNFVATHDGSARLNVNAVWLPWVATVDKTWTYNSVALNNGVNLLSGSTFRVSGGFFVFGTIPQFIYEKKTDLASQGQQKVFLDWSDAGIDDQIKAIAVHTLTGPLSAADQNAFVAGVKDKVASFFTSAYSGQNVVLVAADGPDVHRVFYHGEDSCDLYGSSPLDYKNLNKHQVSNVYIGSFKCTVVDDDELLTSTPALLSDTMATRIADIGIFIGRTTAHEVGHSLGLVAEGDTLLHGCEGGHNCEAYDNANPADRFDIGHHIMDPGPKSELFARIGQANATTRQSQTPIFEAYGKSYLEIIHP
jgi:hypothetical protein